MSTLSKNIERGFVPMTMFRLYMKAKDMKRFQALDWRAGRPVGNLIYATLFTMTEAEQALAEAKRCNPEIEFKLGKTL